MSAGLRGQAVNRESHWVRFTIHGLTPSDPEVARRRGFGGDGREHDIHHGRGGGRDGQLIDGREVTRCRELTS